MLLLNDSEREFIKHNSLFEKFSDAQLNEVISFMTQVIVKSGDVIVNEHDVSDVIYIIKEGEVQVEKWNVKSRTTHVLTTLTAGAVIGEIAALDNAPRSASVRAMTDAKLFSVSLNKLKECIGSGFEVSSKLAAKIIALEKLANEARVLTNSAGFYPSLVQNFISTLTKRLRNADDIIVENQRRELEYVKLKLSMSILIILIVILATAYIVTMKFLETLSNKVISTTMISAPILLIMTAAVLVQIYASGYPKEFYGITLKDWRQSIKEAIPLTIALMVVVVIFKWFLLNSYSELNVHHVFEPNLNSWKNQLWAFIYFLFVPFQEIIARGAMQSSFEEIYSNRKWLAIFLSNLLFSAPHFHLSMLLGIEVFFTGACWGWVYSKRRSLVGVIFSHAIVGLWALNIVGNLY